MYCFSYFQKEHTLTDYTSGDVRSVRPDKIIALFENALAGKDDKLTENEKQFARYIRNRTIMQWGGLADQFDEYERRHRVTLQLLRFFDKIDYPLSFSTKAAWWTEDEQYMELFRKHGHNWHVKISIITANEKKARVVEGGVPSPEKRFEAIRNLTDAGIHVTLRLRPYIIGISDDWKVVIDKANEAGADSITTEFFCLESRADEKLKKRYKKISDVAGFDIHKFYMENSKQSGYKRLSRKIKLPIAKEMKEYAEKKGMRFLSSDSHLRDLCDGCNCCGVPKKFNSHKGHIGEAIQIAKEKGEVSWSDIKDSVENLFWFNWDRTAQYNTGSNKQRAKRLRMTMADFLHNNWNNPNGQLSPAKAYGGVLVPERIDENGDVVYRYNGERE